MRSAIGSAEAEEADGVEGSRPASRSRQRAQQLQVADPPVAASAHGRFALCGNLLLALQVLKRLELLGRFSHNAADLRRQPASPVSL